MEMGYWFRRLAPDALALAAEDLVRLRSLVTIPTLARLLGASQRVVRDLLRRNRIEPIRGRTFYDPHRVAALFRDRLNDLADDRAQDRRLWPDRPLVPNRSRRPGGPTYRDRLDPARLEAIERRAVGRGQWLSCDEAAEVLGVTTRTLLNWRRARNRARNRGESLDLWPAFFASPDRGEPTGRDPETGVMVESLADWRRDRDELVPSSRRDPATGQATALASGRYPPVVYDRNLLVSWARKWARR